MFCARFPEPSINNALPAVAEPTASPIESAPPEIVCHVGAVPVPFDTSDCPDVPYCPFKTSLFKSVVPSTSKSNVTVDVAVVEVAVKYGSLTSPVSPRI